MPRIPITGSLLTDLLTAARTDRAGIIHVAVVIETPNTILLLHQGDGDDFSPHRWDLPAGSVLPPRDHLDEAIRHAVTRAAGYHVAEITGYLGRHDDTVADTNRRTLGFTVTITDPARIHRDARRGHQWLLTWRTPLTAIGARRLRELTAADVHQALTAMAGRYSSAAVAMGHNALTRAIRHAESRDLVGRNVAMLVDTPKGQAGRPSKSLSLEQASACWLPQPAPGCTRTFLCAWLPESAPRRRGRCAGRMSTSAIQRPSRPYRQARQYGDQYEHTETPKPRNRAARWACPRWPSTRSGLTRSDKPRNGSPQARNGGATISSSQPGPAAP
jgi:hypothetical protein